MTRDNWVALLTFVAAVIALAGSTLNMIPANVQPFLVFAVGVINLALAIFFQVAQPVVAAYRKGVSDQKLGVAKP